MRLAPFVALTTHDRYGTDTGNGNKQRGISVTGVWHALVVPIRSRVLIHPAPSGAPASVGSEGS